jgi:hypothetical protein
MAIAKHGKYYFLMMCIVGSITIAASCKNKDLPPPVGAKTGLNVINATGDTIKFFINGTRQNNFTPIFIGGATGYLTVLAGEQNYRFSKSNEGFPTLFTTTYNLVDSTYYSIFVGGETANQAFKIKDPIDSLLTAIQADTTTATNVNAFVRYVNATPGTDKFDVTVGGGDTVNLKGYAFGTWSIFKPFISGLKHVKVYLNSSGALQLDTSITFNAGIGYTLFTHGQLTGKGGNTFGVGVIPNVQ